MMDLTDKLSTLLNKYKYNYKSINTNIINLLSKTYKAVYLNISIEYNDNNIKSLWFHIIEKRI